MTQGREESTSVLERPGPARPTLRGRLRRFRAKVRRRPQLNRAWRCAIGVLGALVLVAGVLMIPYPGPGWLVVFAGLGILATEFAWAGRVLRWARGHYDRWMAWVSRRHIVVKALLGLMTCAVVLLTIWLLGGFGIVANLVGLGHWTWLQSPIM